MKNLFNRYTISAIITAILPFLVDIQNITGLPIIWVKLIGLTLAVLSIVKTRIDNINDENLKKSENSKGFLYIRVTLIDGLKSLFLEWLSDFNKENFTVEKNYPSHIFLGLASMLFLASIIHPPHWSFYIVGALFFGFSEGMIIEQIQVKLFEGKYDDSDVRMTVNGHFLGLIFLFVLSLFNIQLSFVFSLSTSIVLIAFSILSHTSFLNKK